MSGSGARVYAGIGARATPPAVLAYLEEVAEGLARAGWTLRSGASPGADTAFERGALRGGGAVELYLPRRGFGAPRPRVEDRAARVTLAEPTTDAWRLAPTFHPDWEGVPADYRPSLARDLHQVLGPNLDDPVRWVVCWTPDGAVRRTSARTGGTGQAIRVAVAHGIPVLNLRWPSHRARVLALVAACIEDTTVGV